MRLIATIQDCPVYELDDGSVSYVAKAAVDADGAGPSLGDPCWQPRTSLRHDDGSSLDATKERYIVVPQPILQGVKPIVQGVKPIVQGVKPIVQGVKPIVLGCLAHVLYQGRCVEAVVGDIGPHDKLGEISVACAEALGIPSSPVNGGVSGAVVHYVLWVGTAAPGYRLRAA